MSFVWLLFLLNLLLLQFKFLLFSLKELLFSLFTYHLKQVKDILVFIFNITLLVVHLSFVQQVRHVLMPQVPL